MGSDTKEVRPVNVKRIGDLREDREERSKGRGRRKGRHLALRHPHKSEIGH